MLTLKTSRSRLITERAVFSCSAMPSLSSRVLIKMSISMLPPLPLACVSGLHQLWCGYYVFIMQLLLSHTPFFHNLCLYVRMCVHIQACLCVCTCRCVFLRTFCNPSKLPFHSDFHLMSTFANTLPGLLLELKWIQLTSLRRIKNEYNIKSLNILIWCNNYAPIQ